MHSVWDGFEPNAERTACVACEVGFAGTGGQCDQCLAGQEPNADRTACQACAVGYAGTGGVCEQCYLARSLTALQCHA